MSTWRDIVRGAAGRARTRSGKAAMERAGRHLASDPEQQLALEAADRLGGAPAATALLRKLVAKRSPAEVARRAERALTNLRKHERALAKEQAAVAKWGPVVARYRERGVIPPEES